MIRDRNPNALWIPKYLMASGLPDLNELELLDDPDSLIRGKPRNPLSHTAISRVVTLIDS